MRIYLTSQQVLSFRKQGVADFLNGLTANDMDAPQNAFLSIHGRIVAACAQIAISQEEYQLVVGQDYVRPLLEHLDRYIKLGGIKVAELPRRVYHDLDNTFQPADAGIIPLPAGRLVLTEEAAEPTVSEQEYTLFRLHHKLPLQGIDFRDEMLLNVDTSRMVSFTKGCFLGQEPISKVHNRSKPTWRLAVKAVDVCSPEELAKMTSRTMDPADQKEYGFVFEKNE